MYFGQDATHSTVRKRIHAFLAEGVEVVGFTFRRKKINPGFQPDWRNFELGFTTDRAYVRRLLGLVKALYLVCRQSYEIRDADAFYARNFDQNVVAIAAKLLIRLDVKIVYEVPDIQAFFTRKSAVGGFFRALERLALRRTALVVCSSPGFQHDYFERVQRHPGPYYVWENKVLASALPSPVAARPPATSYDGPWKIGWFGTLRCVRSIKLLCDLADRFPDRLEIHSRGVPTETGLEAYCAMLAERANFLYEGEYVSPDELHAMYERVHFVWCFDFHDAGGNSEMLLPNRLYEGGLYGGVMLAHAAQESGRYVAERDIGFVFDEPLQETLSAFFENVSFEDYNAKRENVLAAAGDFIDDGADTRALISAIADL